MSRMQSSWSRICPSNNIIKSIIRQTSSYSYKYTALSMIIPDHFRCIYYLYPLPIFHSTAGTLISGPNIVHIQPLASTPILSLISMNHCKQLLNWTNNLVYESFSQHYLLCLFYWILIHKNKQSEKISFL